MPAENSRTNGSGTWSRRRSAKSTNFWTRLPAAFRCVFFQVEGRVGLSATGGRTEASAGA